MSRSWEGDNGSDWWQLDQGRWERNERVVLKSKRGQKYLRELEAALLALPEPRLIKDDLCIIEDPDLYGKTELPPAVCAIGAMALQHNWTPHEMADRYGWMDTCKLGTDLGMSWTMAWLVGENNDAPGRETPEQVYERVLAWTRSHIKPTAAPDDGAREGEGR